MKTVQIFFILFVGILNASSSLIVYNSNMGLVHEERKLTLKKGDTQILYKGVARSIESDSVNVVLPKGVELFSQQYRYDKLTRTKLLEKTVGKTVLHKGVKVTLLAFFAKEALVRMPSHKIRTVQTQDIVFEQIPASLMTQPSLVWNIQTHKAIDATMELDYIVKNITWRSYYIVNLDEDEADLSGWISIDNHSGKAFQETALYVLAGDVHRVHRERMPQMRSMKAMMAEAPAVREEAHEGYHFYKIPFQVNLANNEKTAMQFLNKEGISIKREYRLRAVQPQYLHGEVRSDVEQFVSLKGFDTPLPKGTFRVYSKLHGTSVLIGEDAIEHTPQKTDIQLKIGKNFDIKVKQTLMQRNDDKERFRVSVKYTLKNTSNAPKEIALLVPFNTRADSIVETKEKYKLVKGNLLRFLVRVPSNATKTFHVYYESKK